MRRLTQLAFALLVGLTSSAAIAFDVQQAGKAPGAAPAAPAPSAPDKGAGASFALPEAGKASGTEVRIPGLGKLGVLPKMDFGLELLYGAAEPKRIEEPSSDQPDDLVVRGTVKHRF
jgi:hypothetical protein